MYSSLKEVADRRKEQVDILITDANERFNIALEQLDNNLFNYEGDITFTKDEIIKFGKSCAFGLND